MIFSDNCWLKNECNKYKRDDCECKFSNIYCIKLHKLDYLYDEANIPIALRKNKELVAEDCDVDVFDKLVNIKNNICDFVNTSSNLFLYSNIPGNGKTSWSLKLLQSYFNNIWADADLKCKALFINVPQLLIELKNNISRKSDYITHILDNIYDCDLVIWDDIGTKVGTEYELEHLYTFINGRINNGKSNIYTSNLGPKELNNVIGPRLVSRIIDLSTNIKIQGCDKRGIIL